MVIAFESLTHLNAHELREMVMGLRAEVAEHGQQISQRDETIARKDREIFYRQAKIDQLTHEMAVLKRWKFGRSREQLDSVQASLLDEAIDADIAAIEQELQSLTPAPKANVDTGQQPKRAALPPELPRVDKHHEPDSTLCTTAGLLAQVLVAKYADHLPLYRQEGIFTRAGMALPRSTLAQWVGVCGVQLQPLIDALKEQMLNCRVLHADETPVAMLKPGNQKTHRAYLWAYAPGVFEDMKAVVYDFCESRAGEHARAFLGEWKGALVCDDFAGYKASFTLGITEVGCLAHSRRKFFDLHVSNKSEIAAQALSYIGALYDVEREVKTLSTEERLRIRQAKSKPLADVFYQWMVLHRQKITDGSATARALDYSLKRWGALTRFVDDGQLPIDNNWAENQIRPIAIGRKNWLFAGSLRAGQRAAAVMSLIQSARLNGHDPYAYLKDVLQRLPTQKNHQIAELLPHHWQPLHA